MIEPGPATVVLRASHYRRTGWKNGGGETMEIAIAPTGASLDTFDWRLSMATVASDGPFSTFAGVDRTLCVLDGAGIDLQMGDALPRRLDDASAPFSFSGDAAAQSRLINGAVTDFNVMTRRDRFDHTVERIHLHEGERLDLSSDVRAIFCHKGAVSIETGAARERLEARDTMTRGTRDARAWKVFADDGATALVVKMWTC